jgi:FdhE protein
VPTRSEPNQRNRGEPREIAALRQLRLDHPELASAIDLQIELVELHRRVQARVPMPWMEIDQGAFREDQQLGRPLLRFESIPLNWTDFRLMFRRTADILRRHDAIDPDDHRRMEILGRTPDLLQSIVSAWYQAKADRVGRRAGKMEEALESAGPSAEALDQVVTLALRPFLSRSAELLQQRADFDSWNQPYCPVCGGDPEFAVITQSAERLLICTRCSGRWRFGSLTCPSCRNDVRGLITSFTSRDGTYRIYACEVCRRYLKAYDERHAARPLLLPVDTVATLPLDAAAMQKGYSS